MKLYSVHTLLRGRSFEGSFELGGSTYRLSYAPLRADIVENRLRLQGKLKITGPSVKERDGVSVRLVSSQGGIGSGPSNLTATRMQAAKTESERDLAMKLSATDSTGPTSFAGVLFFQCEPFNGTELGVPAELDRLQINLRISPVDELASRLQGVFSLIADSLLAEKRDVSAAEPLIKELNRLLTPA